MGASKCFEKQELITILERCLDKTLGEVDENHVFQKAIDKPKITGIAGDVIEQSVLKYPPNVSKDADLEVNGVPTELKTTGTRKIKEKIVAKEPLTLTNVSPNNLIHEEWETSEFLSKVAHLLFVYYLYASKKVVPAIEYRNFKIIGYQFYDWSKEELEILKNDWTIVRDAAIEMSKNLINPVATDYGALTKLRSQTMMLDMCSPHALRFRVKRKSFNEIIQQYFSGKLEQLPESYTSLNAVDAKLHEMTVKFKGKTIKELVEEFEIKGKIDKAIGERVICKMFGASKTKMNKIALFSEACLLGKLVVLSKNDGRTEDMKLFRLHFEEFENPDLDFDDSDFKALFTDNKLICIMFKEPSHEAPLTDNKFLGFKRYSFSDEFIENSVRPVFNRIKSLIQDKTLVDVPVMKKDRTPKINKTGVASSAPNFPKSTDSPIFVRGDSSDSTNKPEEVNGIKMYNQYLWIKGALITEELNKLPEL